MAKTAIFLADGFEEIEGLTVVDLLRRAGIGIQTVSITDRPEVRGLHDITVRADTLLKDVDFDALDMLILPGGMPGTTNLEACAPLKAQIEAFDKSGKYISAICAAPGIFGRMGLLKGRKACSHPDWEHSLTGADVQRTETAVSDHILTSRGMGTAIPFGLAIVERFQGKEAADALAAKIVYRQ